MRFTRTTVIRLFRGLALVGIAAMIIAYAIWRSLNYARGPIITIFEPSNDSAILSSPALIRGQAERVNRLSLNGQAISVDQGGRFRETVIVFPGLNKLTLAAED